MPKIKIINNTDIDDNDNDKLVIGYISFYHNDNDISVNFINITENYRGLGFGTELLWRLYDYIIDNKNYNDVNYVFWDDCSDNCRLVNNNIYIKVGSRYVYRSGPEMVWKIRSRVVKNKRKEYRLKLDMSKYKLEYS